MMTKLESKVKPIIFKYSKGNLPLLQVLDQRLIPYEKKYLELKSYKDVISAIKNMVVRGAPLIGITAAYGMALAAYESPAGSLRVVGEEIKQSRPTAINLKWAIDLILNDISILNDNDEIMDTTVKRAIWIHEDDKRRCEEIGKYGAKIIPKGAKILTICNTGALATGGIGTAFGVILTAHKNDPSIKVFASETRPRQQGARLTTFECKENGIDCTLITDTACGYLIKNEGIDLVISGADRIAANGDTANKIGTYQLSVLAKENGIPFYVAAPISTFDLSIKSGNEIPIEERGGNEVSTINGKLICIEGTEIKNPAFDVTEAKYITGIITEKGILRPDYIQSIDRIVNEPTMV